MKMLESLLPSKFEYRVGEVKILEQSEILEEQRFHASFEVNICRKGEAEEFLRCIASKNGTDFKAPRKEKIRMGYSSNRYNCGRNVRDQRSAKEEIEVKRSGQGRVKGEERQKGKGTECGAHFTYKLLPCIHGHEDDDEGDRECFNLSIRLKHDHNHEIVTTDAWNFLDVSEETKDRYFQLFSDAFSPSKARLAYIAEMKAKLGEDEFFKISARRSVNPDSRTVFNLYTVFCKRFGSINGPDAFMKAVELIERINEKSGERIASIRQLEDKTIVVAVCDDLMRRTHSLVPQSGDVIFVDATGSVDRCNHQV